MPSTSAQFWTGLLTQESVSTKDLLPAAFSALKIKPTPEQTVKMKQRVANAIATLSKAGILKSTGKGRERRFSLNA